jgi:hypothetical protein
MIHHTPGSVKSFLMSRSDALMFDPCPRNWFLDGMMASTHPARGAGMKSSLPPAVAGRWKREAH